MCVKARQSRGSHATVTRQSRSSHLADGGAVWRAVGSQRKGGVPQQHRHALRGPLAIGTRPAKRPDRLSRAHRVSRLHTYGSHARAHRVALKHHSTWQGVLLRINENVRQARTHREWKEEKGCLRKCQTHTHTHTRTHTNTQNDQQRAHRCPGRRHEVLIDFLQKDLQFSQISIVRGGRG